MSPAETPGLQGGNFSSRYADPKITHTDQLIQLAEQVNQDYVRIDV